MAAQQITIRISPGKKASFAAYADRLGIGDSQLLRLLIVRERTQGRMPALGGRPRRRTRVNHERLPTVTAHLSSVDEVIDFDKHAAAHGTNRNGAGMWLIEMELKERWLEKAIETL